VIELKVSQFNDGSVPQLQQLGLTVKAIELMDLEDIFVTSIRGGATS
jgi:hypothetical protein